MSARIAVVYYSATGNVHAIAEAVAEGAADAGAEVRLRRTPEIAPKEAIDGNPEWRAHLDATADVETAKLDDLVWADGYAFGTPTRFGNVASQLKQFIDTAGGIWEAGELVDKVATGFTSSYELHGGQESTLLSLYNVMYHWGSMILPTGYADYDIIHEAGGNPYGLSSPSGQGEPSKDLLKAAKFQGGRLAKVSAAVAPLRATA
ncbi:NAD(P)H:quinone oxidoreductase [Parasphingorhabdus pacifica]